MRAPAAPRLASRMRRMTRGRSASSTVAVLLAAAALLAGAAAGAAVAGASTGAGASSLLLSQEGVLGSAMVVVGRTSLCRKQSTKQDSMLLLAVAPPWSPAGHETYGVELDRYSTYW